MALRPDDDLHHLCGGVGHRPQVHDGALHLAVEPELQGAVGREGLVGQVRVVVAAEAGQRDLRRRVAEVDAAVEHGRAGRDDAEVARRDGGVEVEPRPLSGTGRRRLGLDRGPDYAVDAALEGDGHGRRQPLDADRRDDRGRGEHGLVGLRRDCGGACGLLQRAQVAVEDVDRAGDGRDVGLALIERIQRLLDAPELDAPVREIRQEEVKLVVGDVDVLRRQGLRGQFAPTRGVFNHATRVEIGLRYCS